MNKFDKALQKRNSQQSNEKPDNDKQNKDNSKNQSPSEKDNKETSKYNNQKPNVNEYEPPQVKINDLKKETPQPPSEQIPSEQVPTVEKTVVIDGQVQTQTDIVKSSYSQLSNLKSNEVISKIIKRTKEKDELAEFLHNFPNKNKNEIVDLFIDEILKQREKEVRRRMLGYTKKKPQSFKESKETFSMPVRPEMKQLLNIISLFSGSNKYIFFEDLIIRACRNFDFEKDFFDDELE